MVRTMRGINEDRLRTTHPMKSSSSLSLAMLLLPWINVHAFGNEREGLPLVPHARRNPQAPGGLQG